MTRIDQALIAIGGRASRLRGGGVDVPISKAFLDLCGHPFLYWNLLSVHSAGFTRLVLSGDNCIQFREAEAVLADLPVDFAEVLFYMDPGLGVHGLPYQTRHLLDRVFLFECGHSIIAPSHYRLLAARKQNNNVVFSAFLPHPTNPRQPVHLARNSVRLREIVGCYAVAHPFVVDQPYSEMLPLLDYNISRIISYYAMRGELEYVMSELPPEFDLIEELMASLPIYEDYVQALSSQPAMI